MHLPPTKTSWMVLLALVMAGPAAGQSLQERIDDVREKRAREAARAQAEQPDLQINERLAQRIDFTAGWVTVERALQRWSGQTGIPLVIDWNAMEIEGVDPGTELEIELENIPADLVLLRIMDAMSQDLKFVAEAHPWGVQIRTKAQANQDVMTKVYDVTDLVVDVPQFTDAPSLSLEDALSRSGEGGGVFNVEDMDDEDRSLSKRERGELLIQLVRDTIEPDIWQANGGEFSRIRYRRGRMIVRAPLYVHVQIGRAAIE